MQKIVVGLIAAVTATASPAAIVTIDFSTHPGNLGTSETYTNGPLSVTAYGYTDVSTAGDLYGKNAGGDENGLGLASDPSHDNEIWYNGFRTTPHVDLDVSALFGLVTSAQFSTGSTTDHEQWLLYGWNGSTYTFLTSGMTEGVLTTLPNWGTYSRYAFVSGGTVNGETRTAGNFLIAGLSLTTGVPEPSTWAMMLLGFGAIGLTIRRRRSPALAYLA